MKTEWQTKKLGDIGKVSMCKRVFKEQTATTGDIPFYKIGTFGKEPDAFISKEIYNEFRKKFSFPKKGDILISASGTIGRRVKYDGNPSYFQDSNIVWIDNDEKQVLNDYLYYFYGTCDWNSTKGATISRLYNENLKRIEISFPSISDQVRIVKLIDDVFEQTTKVRENTEKNLQNARDIFDSYLQRIFDNSKKNWEEKALKEICDQLFAGGDVPKKNLSKEKTEKYNIPIYANGFKDKGLYGYTDIKKVTQPSVTISARGTIGYAEVREEVFFPIVRLIVLIPKVSIDLYFLYYITHNFKFSNTGSSIPQLTIPMIENIKIPVLPIPEQKSIVKKLDELSEQTKKLEEIYKKKLENIEELKKSILKKAFSGEL